MNNIKYCPFMMIARVIGETAGGVGMSRYFVSADIKCGKESCALWNERKNRCGLICKIKSVPKEKK